MMNWDDLRFFLALDRARTFKGASTALGVHGSTASRRLEQLELDVGTTLFSRTPDGLVPTGAADRIRTLAAAVELDVQAVERALHGWESIPAGVVRVALLDSLATHLVAPRAGELLRTHPGVQLELVAGTAVLDLTRGDADLALRLVRPSRGDLVYKQVATVQMAVFVHERLARALPDVVRPADLAWCGWHAHGSPGPDAQWLAGHVPEDRFVFRSGNLDVLVRAVAGGAGAGLLPGELMADYPQTVRIEMSVPLPPQMPVWLVCHRALRRVPRVHAVWAWLEGLMREVRERSSSMA
jgi:DNA-binding transcriptional LysR family regulator